MEKPWAKAVLDLAVELKTSLEEGLTVKEYKLRLKKYGYNSLEYEKPPSPFKILWRQFSNIFVIILLFASLIAFYTEGVNQALILWIIIFVNVILGFLQENKAERALQALKESIVSHTTVIRHKVPYKINALELVPGDLVVLQEGDQIPADIRLAKAENLQVNEAILTGESSAVNKITSVLSEELNVLEAHNLVFSGTTVVSGRGQGIVIATGRECQFGKIAKLINTEEGETPLEERLKYLAKNLTTISVVLSLLLFILGLARGWPFFKVLTYSIAILVATVPESLPTTITLALAIGVVRMSRKKAIVRKLSSVETLGVIQVIATDKTGTLTKNQLSVAEVVVPENNHKQLTWERICLAEDDIIGPKEEERIKEFLRTSVLCTDASINGKSYIGDPTEVSILLAAKSFSIESEEEKNKNKRLAEFPFDSTKGYMVTFHRNDKEKFLIAKGSFEKISKFCNLTKIELKSLKELADKMANEGMRVLAVAEKKSADLEESSLRNLKIVGLLGMIDLPSESAEESLKRSMEAGIRPVIITGDNPLTAMYVARSVGLEVEKNEVMLGHELDKFSPSELKSVIGKIKIFARVSPEHKINIVKAFKKAGFKVAVTGDGVNDAPALKAADVGVAMGQGGTAVAKEAADIILLDNNYGTIVEAVRWGRAIYENIQKAIVFLISGNFIELIIVALAMIFSLPVPITAIQIIWINLVTDGLPAMAFAVEPPEKDIMRRGPGRDRKDIITRLIKFSLILSILALPAIIITYFYYLHFRPELVSTAVLTLIIFIELAFALSIHAILPFWRDFKGLFSNVYLWLSILFAGLIQIILVETKLGGFMTLKNLDSSDYLLIAGGTLITFLISELLKSFFYREYLGTKQTKLS